MTPIQELLNRIRWDKEFARGNFEIGYYDRIEDEVKVAPFHEIRFEKDDHYSFQITDDEGEVHTIPFHRVRKVYKDGELIWSRER